METTKGWSFAFVLSVLLLHGSLSAAQRTPKPQGLSQDLETGATPNELDNRYSSRYDPRLPFRDNNVIINEATYFIVTSRMVRPGQLYRVSVTVLQAPLPLTVRASISRNGVEVSADIKTVKEDNPEVLMMRIPPTSVGGDYNLRVEGTYDRLLGGTAFVNETKLTFSQRSLTIFIQTDKPVYRQGQTVRFRAIPINTELRPFNDAVDVYMLDPNRHIMRRWLSRQSNLGTVSLSYKLSDQPVYGEWTIQVTAQGQIEEEKILVEEYYQTRFEVNVTMPAFFFDTDEYIYGTIMANYTSGAPVHGNLTLKATIRPLKPQYRNIDRSPVVERFFNFDENFPFWYSPSSRDSYSTASLRNFYGVYEFKYPMRDLEALVPQLDGMEVVITATVGDRFLDEIIEGYSNSRIFNSSVQVTFLGGSPQVFKPAMPFQCYLAVSFQDGSPLSRRRLRNGRMEVKTEVTMQGGGRRSFDSQEVKMLPDKEGVWEMKIDLRSQFEGETRRIKDIMNSIYSMRLSAYFKDSEGERATAEMLVLSHFSPTNHHIKVYTSTKYARVGEYIILHVQSNFYMEQFNYIVLSKGIILLASQENMQSTIKTFAVTLSAEMAPAATIIVYHVGRYGEVVADSLTFPVNGISRNNFTVFINNRKARTGERVEVAIYGEPGAHVALSGIDRSFYTMQAGNELSYSEVFNKMATFDEDSNGTLVHMWFSHEGNPDDIVYFPSSTYGIDANRTFEYAGLIVFTDAEVPRRPGACNMSQGYGECLSGRCFRLEKLCDGRFDCDDGSDESSCRSNRSADLAMFRKFRFNRIQRLYENVWLWKDINIGPHGRYIFSVPVPSRPAHWMVSSFSMSPNNGFGMLSKAIEYVGVLPFFINVEMPTLSMQGEQVGIRVTVFNYLTSAIEAIVVLANSKDYKFVHVGENGIVRSYNPETSFGEHQHFVWIPAQDVSVVYIPIVPTRLGDIYVTIQATALNGKDQVTKKLHVESDGLPQYRHESVLLDLSNRAYVFQHLHVNVTETPIIPYEEIRYYVYGSNRARLTVVGDVVGPIFPTMPVNATSLLNLPMDCAEQNMFSFAANLYTTMYMRLINQRNRSLEKQSFYHMNIAYQQQMSFMMSDGSFSFFRSDWNQSASSVWLTAYCARILQEASFYEWENFIYIDPQVIAKSVSWVLDHQTEDGAFYEITWLADRKMNSSLMWPNDHIRYRNISLTAHVLITLETVKDLAGGLGSRVALAQAKAIQWLERNLKLLEVHGEPYEVAIVAYALMLSRAATAETAFNILTNHARHEGGLTYFAKEPVPPPPYKLENQRPYLLPRLPYKYDSINIETTAYALLTYVARRELLIEPMVKWLTTQRLTDGGWASTQDTAVSLKALVDYTVKSRLREVSSLTVTVESTTLKDTRTLYITDSNLGVLQYIDIPEASGTVKVQAKGAGYAILQMSVQYNVDIPRFQTSPPVTAFDLRTKATFAGRNNSRITYFSCQRWTHLEEAPRSGMAVLEVTVPTGYIIQQQDLDAYIRSRLVRNLQRARFFERKVVFYFDYLDDSETCVNFTVERWYPVANMSRYLASRVYDYYAPERFNETMFDAITTYLLNICEVCGSSQCPYCPIYSWASHHRISVVFIAISVALVLLRTKTMLFF